MKKNLTVMIILGNVICLGWLTFLLVLAPAHAKPLEALIANKTYDDVVDTGIEIVKSQASDFYLPCAIIIVINICFLIRLLMNKKEQERLN